MNKENPDDNRLLAKNILFKSKVRMKSVLIKNFQRKWLLNCDDKHIFYTRTPSEDCEILSLLPATKLVRKR